MYNKPEEKLYRTVSEFSTVCERRKLKVNVGKSKVMRSSKYVNILRMAVRLNSQPLAEGNCLTTWNRKGQGW